MKYLCSQTQVHLIYKYDETKKKIETNSTFPERENIYNKLVLFLTMSHLTEILTLKDLKILMVNLEMMKSVYRNGYNFFQLCLDYFLRKLRIPSQFQRLINQQTIVTALKNLVPTYINFKFEVC